MFDELYLSHTEKSLKMLRRVGDLTKTILKTVGMA
jgi:hypothetical protein